MSDDESTPIVEIADTPSCPRCHGESPLHARVPHTWTNGQGREIHSYLSMALCPACDLDTPAASALIIYLHVHGSITDETAEQFVDLVHAWIADRYARHASGEAFEADIADRNGEFD